MKKTIVYLCALFMLINFSACSNSVEKSSEKIAEESNIVTENETSLESEVTTSTDESESDISEGITDLIITDEIIISSSEETTDESEDNFEMLEAFGDVEVEKGVLYVTLNIPAEFIEELKTQEDCDALAKEKGYKSITLNEDGSATYVITKEQHNELIESVTSVLVGDLDAMIESEKYPKFKDITYNDDFTEFQITYAGDEVSLGDSFSVLVFYAYSGMYNVFTGNTVENCNVKFINESSGEMITESNSRDMK